MIICSHKSPVPWFCHLTQWIRALCAKKLAGLHVSSLQVKVYCNIQGTQGDFYSEETFWIPWYEAWTWRHTCEFNCWCLGLHWDIVLHRKATCSSRVTCWELIYPRSSWDSLLTATSASGLAQGYELVFQWNIQTSGSFFYDAIARLRREGGG